MLPFRGNIRDMRKALLVVGACGAIVGGCGDDAEPSAGWLGRSPHAAISGSVNDEDLSIQLAGETQVAAAEITCEREYDIPVVNGAPDPAMAKLVGFEIGAVIEVNGELRAFELDVEGPNLGNHIGKDLGIVPDGSDPEEGQAIVEIKWTRVADEAELLDTSTDTGTLVIEEIIGEPGEGGVVIPDNIGAVGVTGKLRFGANDALDISFTANCGENDISELVSAP
jgi:hypothetical protein